MPRFLPSMSESANNSIQDVSVVDVYDLASDIGKECEKIIDAYGTESVQSLIPKCITALEMLEAFASEREMVANELQELNAKIIKLETEKVERSESRKRFEKELEAIEESWRVETRELLAAISRLQEENRRLQKERSESTPPQADSPQRLQSEDFQLIERLKEQIHRQRTEMKSKDLELEEKSGSLDTLRTEMERLRSGAVDSKRKSRIVQSQVRTLCEERADFLAKIQDQHREVIALRRQLGIAEKESEDIASHEDDENHRPRFTVAELKEVLAERNELKKRVNDLEEELVGYRPVPVAEPSTTSEGKDDEESTTTSEANPMVESIYDPYDLPVQGPLPQEPNDAPWKKSSASSQNSGVRKFFQRLFSENDSSFPRSVTIRTLKKMALSGPNGDINI